MRKEINLKNYFSLIFFALLLLFLFLFLRSSLGTPLLSDCLEMFYSFHNLNNFPGPLKWMHVLNLDAFERMRYQPVSHLFYYLSHLLFGANFIYYKIINFVFYFLAAAVLYMFSAFFCDKKITRALAVGIFTFLFSHFGIAVWAHHIYIIFGMLVFLLGFISYIRFMSSGKKIFTYLAGLCFLVGMWCYEPFFFWPFAVLILVRMNRFRNEQKPHSSVIAGVMLGIVYIIYAAFYLFTRSLGTYASPAHGLVDLLKPVNFIASAFLVLFNFAYNGILVNIFPFLAYPLTVTENVYMRGPLLSYIRLGHEWIVYAGGSLVGLAIAGFYAYLYKKKYFEEIKILSFFFFLMFSVMYVLFFCRLVTNSFIYGMTEFRYQYVQNAFIVLIAVFVIDWFIRFSPKIKALFGLVMAVVLILNIYCARQEIKINNEQLADLKKILSNINRGMQQGYINEQHKLFLQNDVTEYLPSLCWNIEVGDKYILTGTYQWMFSSEQIRYFAKNLDESSWVIDIDDFSVIPKEKMHAPARKRISQGKDDQYLNLANFYRKHKKFKQAEEILQYCLKVNPENYEFYYYLRDCYLDQGLTEKAEITTHKAEEMYDDYCLRLANDYRKHKKFKQAEAVLQANLKSNPDNYKFYYALRDCYLDQGLAKKAGIANHKAEELQNSQSAK